MNRGRKIAAMVTQNEVNTHVPINKDANTGTYLENWVDTGNGIEFDTNRLNGIYIDDYDMVIDTINYDELVENNTSFNNNNIDITTTQFNSIVDVVQNNHVLYDTDENNIILNEGINECPILINNSHSDIISGAIESPILPESEIDTESTFENNLDEQLNDGQRQVKYQSQKNRLAGKEYIGFKMVDGKISQCVPIGKRVIKERCNHSLINQKSSNSFMCGLFSDEDRKNAFKFFCKIKTWQEKRGYVRGLVTNRPITRRRKISKSDKVRKIESRDIRLCLTNGRQLKVCRKMFLNTLSIGEDCFKRWTKKINNISNSNSSESEHDHEPISLTPSPRVLKKQNDIIHIKDWLHLLPKVPSHYCRQSTSKIYVESNFVSIESMFNVFKEWCVSENITPFSCTLFRETLNANNIKIHQPRKDQCDLCIGYKMDTILEAEYNEHIERKNSAREEKNKHKSTVSNKKVVITMDLESVLLCPKTEASAMFYKQKLQLHNFTIYKLNDHDVTLYVWNESDGNVTANEFTTCIINYIDNLSSEVSEVVLISDGCNYQNRNKTLASALSSLALAKCITIEQLFLTKGHTMMEADNVHSTLEHYFKAPLYSPGDYISRMRIARKKQPYNIKVIDYSFFKNFDAVCSLKSLIPGKKASDKVVTNICKLLYTKEGEIFYKTSFGNDWAILHEQNKIIKRTRASIQNVHIPEQELNQLYNAPLPISSSKYNDLQSLKQVIEKDHHPFYDSLKHSDITKKKKM